MSKALARAGRLKDWPELTTGGIARDAGARVCVDTKAEATGTTAAMPKDGSASCDAR